MTEWGCSQVDDDFGEGDVVDWYEDEEMMRQWEEKIEVIKMEGKSLQVERCAEGTGASSIPSANKRKGANEGEEENWLAGPQKRWRRKKACKS